LDAQTQKFHTYGREKKDIGVEKQNNNEGAIEKLSSSNENPQRSIL